ncbi:MAG: hypothetical protein HKN35_12030 [Woeseia sp.]|nr:hypothetical protein [Woeseia sp.]
MNLERRLLMPFVSRRSLRIHKQAQFAYDIWSQLVRQFDPGVLASGGPPVGLDPIHAIRDSRENFHVFANFDNYQLAVTKVMDREKTQISVLHYPRIRDPDIGALSLAYVIKLVEAACLHKSAGIEYLRQLLNDRVDRRVLERVCGKGNLSRHDMARRAGVSAGSLKARSGSTSKGTTQQQNTRRTVVERLSS